MHPLVSMLCFTFVFEMCNNLLYDDYEYRTRSHSNFIQKIILDLFVYFWRGWGAISSICCAINIWPGLLLDVVHTVCTTGRMNIKLLKLV